MSVLESRYMTPAEWRRAFLLMRIPAWLAAEATGTSPKTAAKQLLALRRQGAVGDLKVDEVERQLISSRARIEREKKAEENRVFA